MRPPIDDRRVNLVLGLALWGAGVWFLQAAFRNRRPPWIVRATLPV